MPAMQTRSARGIITSTPPSACCGKNHWLKKFTSMKMLGRPGTGRDYSAANDLHSRTLICWDNILLRSVGECCSYAGGGGSTVEGRAVSRPRSTALCCQPYPLPPSLYIDTEFPNKQPPHPTSHRTAALYPPCILTTSLETRHPDSVGQ